MTRVEVMRKRVKAGICRYAATISFISTIFLKTSVSSFFAKRHETGTPFPFIEFFIILRRLSSWKSRKSQTFKCLRQTNARSTHSHGLILDWTMLKKPFPPKKYFDLFWRNLKNCWKLDGLGIHPGFRK